MYQIKVTALIISINDRVYAHESRITYKIHVHLPTIVTRIKDEDKRHNRLFNVYSRCEESRTCSVQGTNYTMLHVELKK
jgi:hypothetical protein